MQKTRTQRRNIIHPYPSEVSYRAKSGIFKPRRPAPERMTLPCGCAHNAMKHPATRESATAMQTQPEAEFGLADARRILGEVFAPWVQDLDLAVERIEHVPPADAPDWQPGALLRMPFSERLCRHGGVVCGQALMALADTAMVIAILAANRGYRPMTTVDQTTHFMRAISASDVLADARVVRLGRTMSFGRVTLLSAADGKPAAMVSSAFAMLPG